MEQVHSGICLLGELLQYHWGKTEEYVDEEMMNPPGKTMLLKQDKTNQNCAHIFTRGQFWLSGIVVACVCVCVRQSWACPCDNSTVQARITKFGSEM